MIRLDNVFLADDALPMEFDLQVAAGERVAVVGPSGAGKSTLLNFIAGFVLPTRGEIWLNGENHTRSAPYERPVSMLFQENNLFPHLTVQQNLALGLKTSLKLTALEQQQLEQVADAVGLSAFLCRLPNSLSGGQKQRVALARCLLRDKPILLLDEPFSALDPELRMEMLNLIDELCRNKSLTLLLVTHQPSELAGKVDRILRVENGRITHSEKCA
ncbi:thiamine ABC transporter ATP-binding protein [Aggregatibacter actinomycetemcomitans]|uniref:Thiamine ABC transporter ATP-binding protein n=1 Tax=Aggregatibacter actinomycetemcomitans TaxID=714 RepID=A0A5D0EMF9_AGGAC|nr:thiamine ABC transporter ATP-binding protein [Aggregatibacter actinomycetemcomitans]AFI87845.1 thiamine ABC transporter ATP-binding protein [Aggregatibacter actinomycetemcomitans D7S-1]AMQ94798.1 thiamine ABC transporter ATP-binding protein [Aggregatibacter actinomycetemcomitans]EKX93839.1 thiamine ABC transporter, ATP-binding protein [Aggregatibacter actinomycetemcomitans Y4]KND85767.1 thiamine ABC transporter ATP-binding protein [Aggregatibacter actinomycetemcomitans serotype a str. H5P1]